MIGICAFSWMPAEPVIEESTNGLVDDEGGTSSLQSSWLSTKECVSRNKVVNSQGDFESRLAKKGAKQLLQTIECVKALSEVKDDSMKRENDGKKKEEGEILGVCESYTESI